MTSYHTLRTQIPILRLRCDCYAAAQDNWTPLHTRVWHGYAEAAEALIRAGADISARGSVRWPSRQHASGYLGEG